MATEAEELETVDEGKAIREAREMAKRRDRQAKDAAERANKAEAELAAMRAEQRTSDLERQFADLGLPAGLVRVFPEDLETETDTVLGWAKDLGVEPTPKPKAEDWRAYERLQAGQQPPAPADDEMRLMTEENEKALRRIVENPYQFTPDEDASSREAFVRAKEIERQYAKLAESGQVEPLVDYQKGFGGLYDAPEWAKTWKKAQTGF